MRAEERINECVLAALSGEPKTALLFSKEELLGAILEVHKTNERLQGLRVLDSTVRRFSDSARKEVKHFCGAMEVVLLKHDVKKGDSWRSIPISQLRVKLDEEVAEYVSSRKPRELIDIANVCMMLYFRETDSVFWNGSD